MSRVLVTGGAKRIGQAICIELAKRGHDIVVHRNRSDTRETVDAVEALGQKAHVVKGNLEGGSAAVWAAAKGKGPVDHVVHNASEFREGTLAQMRKKDLDAMMHLHAWSPLAINRLAAAQGAKSAIHMLDTRIASHDPAHFAYHMSKQASANLVTTLAKELAPFRVNGVAPGPILPAAEHPDSIDAGIEATLLERAGTPEEVAHAVAFLLEAEYVTGQTVFVDGGRHV